MVVGGSDVTIHTLFFDLGETLITTRPEVYRESAQAITELTGRPVSAAALRKAKREQWKHTPAEQFLWIRTVQDERKFRERYFYPAVLHRLGVSSPPAELIEFLTGKSMDVKSFMAFEEVHEVLAALQSAGVKLGVISNSLPSTENLLKVLDLEHWFRCIIFSHVFGYAKPDPEIFYQALRCAKVSPGDALFVDDRPEFVRCAENEIGIPSILICRGGHSLDGWKGNSVHDLRELLSML